MAKILGLDLGTNSIGWAVVEKMGENEKGKILSCGSRIFPEGVENLGQGEREKSLNAQRRESRQTRRGFFRHRLRRIKLLDTLIELQMCPLSIDELKNWKLYDKTKGKSGKQFPHSVAFIQWLKQNPYELRTRALSDNLSLDELGRIFYHLIQRRGFLSSRKEKDTGAIFKGKDDKVGIEETMKKIGNETLGKYLHSILPKHGEPYKTITDEAGKELRVRNRYTLRDMYIAEFKQIWDKQAAQLGLQNKVKRVERQLILKGNLKSKKNQHRLNYLLQKYGNENITMKGNTISISYQKPLEEFFAGKIYTENETLKHKSKDSLLFFQRPLRSQKGLLSKCSFEGKKYFDKKSDKWFVSGPTPCPVSHPVYEEYRAMQFINNIEYGSEKRLDDFQRKNLLDLFNSKKANFEFSEIAKELKMNSEKFNFDMKSKVPANKTTAQIKPLFDEKTWSQNKEQIWHCFYTYNDSDKLIEKLQKDFGLKIKDFDKDFDKVDGISIEEGYSSVSIRAINNILPFLHKGYKFSMAVILGGVRNAFRDTIDGEAYDRWENFAHKHTDIEKNICKIAGDKNNKEGEAIERIKKYLIENFSFELESKCFKKLYHHSQDIEVKELKQKVGKVENLRNPVVQQTLNELKRLVNKILTEFRQKYPDFKFDRINVELGRDLKNGKIKRQQIQKVINENTELNEKAREKLTEFGLSHTRDNIQKFLLYDEIQKRNGIAICPYTNKTIGLNDLLGRDNKFQIEHIVPLSTSLDDSFGNKTLCDAKFNGMKGNLTPYEFYQKNQDAAIWGAKTWDEIRERAFKLLPYNKAKRFSMEKIAEKSNFIERQLNDTRYISRKAKEILSEICTDVRVLPGTLTAELRHLWGLNNILQPAETLSFSGIEIDSREPVRHWVEFDENNTPVGFYPLQNKRPQLKENQTFICGHIFKNQFSDRSINNIIETHNKADGKYWLPIRILGSPIDIVNVYAPKPETDESKIVLKGKINNKKFENDSIALKPFADAANGMYWGVFDIAKITFVLPEKNAKPKSNSKQVVLYGDVKSGVFKSYIFSCKAMQPEGNIWAIIDLNFDKPQYINYFMPRPEIDNQSVVIEGTVNTEGIFTSDTDYNFHFETTQPAGKYRALFNFDFDILDLAPVVNLPPTIDNKHSIMEGSIWVDKQGEIKFDPKKNREDQRHHAIDAVAIAVSEQSYLQKLSSYSANKAEKMRNNPHDKPEFDEPWVGFANDVKKAANEILISYRKSDKVLTKIKKRIVKNNVKRISIGAAPADQLHKEFVYGKRQAPSEKEVSFHIRKSLTDLKTNKHVDKIADNTIRTIIEQHLKDKFSIDISKPYKIPNNAFFDNGKPLVFLPNKKGEPVPIKKVRLCENIGNAVKLKNTEVWAENKADNVELNQYVNPRNNHHVALYKDKNGNMIEKIVTFWEAVALQKKSLPVINTNSVDGYEFVVSLQINDMFLIGLKDVLDIEFYSKSELLKHLYRVQKLSSMYYTFRHHLASTLDNQEQEIRIQSFKAWLETSPIKVEIDILGNIKPI